MATISATSIITTIGVAFILGVFISFVYMKTYKNGVYTQSFVLTLVMLPIIIALIIILIGSNVARAFSLAGAFSIIRFRSAMGDPKDIAYVFFTMAVGLALGVGYIAYSIVFAIILCMFMFVLYKINFGGGKELSKILKIIIPEDLDYLGAFDDIFDKYTSVYKLTRVKTTNLGSLSELTYDIFMRKDFGEKNFIDELRCRNGNLNIVLSMNNNEGVN